MSRSKVVPKRVREERARRDEWTSRNAPQVLGARRNCVLLGLAPVARDAPRAFAPATASGERLARLCGLDRAESVRYVGGERGGAVVEERHDDLADMFALDNLWPYPAPDAATLRSAAVLHTFLRDWWYVLAGDSVLRAFGRRAAPHAGLRHPGYLRWYEAECGATLAVLPHPSGRNRWYNDVGNRAAASAFLLDAAYEVPQEHWVGYRVACCGEIVATRGPDDSHGAHELWSEAIMRELGDRLPRPARATRSRRST